jgi:hypothetical protein
MQANEILARMEFDPIEFMIEIAQGKLPCGACHGAGVTKFQPARGQQKLAERTCESCYGSGKERVTPDLRGRMAEQVARYAYPTYKQIDHNGAPPGSVSIQKVLVLLPGQPAIGESIPVADLGKPQFGD